MCGIVACRTRGAAASFLLQALATLEYRGYDSAGVAVRTRDGGTMRLRTTGRVATLAERVRREARLDLTGVGIGHTRWATHGGVRDDNAHPHADCTGRLQVVHNGIIENATQLRAELESAGHVFASEVDSEVIAHLVEAAQASGDDLAAAVASTAARLRGSWAVVVLESATSRVVGTAFHAPLLVASSARGSYFASDASAIDRWVDDYQVLGDGDVVELGDPVTWSSDEPARLRIPRLARSSGLGDHHDHMQKEIDEQPEMSASIIDALALDAVSGTLWADQALPPFDRVAVLGCGTSLNAGGVVGAAFRRFGSVPVTTVIASEASELVVEPRTLVIAMSQSGETADILRALDSTALRDAALLAITNNPHSTLARRAAAVMACAAGHEVGVAASKTFVAQVLTGVLLAVSALRATGRIDAERASAVVDDLRRMPDLLAQSLAISKHAVPPLAAELAEATGFLFLGRGSGVVYAAEGALKLKELTYRWAEHYPAGELKHGPLALIEDGTPVIVIDDGDPRLAGNIAEVEARGGRVITIGGPGASVPALGLSLAAPVAGGFRACGPLESVIPLQVLARELALVLGRDVDKPRNLAKSVTVE
ncbi:glutamine--fructose-6-phosphate transaminase (isomerizing) [Galbitalea sp. SE-J8]|uniref:glutamine--fructose-6-phosphate transaminase (isomerizing) n=1 Tax=Galbitalea sp. SE-J8 TaxID=3054952 RepID=UPI00259D0C1F|nr:glutamine--fructose-6-phosphate transaminase (isomerizing) [Galbitalea sp. SE-J8]MDM4763267.1 glutamine--fructose-6-phosphate transaminase (isomerizing) [Galbitalea sp. SE-J8]